MEDGWWEGGSGITNFGVSLHLQDFDTLGDGGAGIVNDIDHGLYKTFTCQWLTALVRAYRWRVAG